MGGKTQAIRARQAEEDAAPSGERWFVVQCLNRQERLAKAHLRMQGFEAYLPMRLCPHPKARNPSTPLLPGYLFVRFDPTIAQWLCILSTVGVSGMIRRPGGMPQVIPDKWIKDLQKEEIDGVIHLVQPKVTQRKTFKPGDKVKIIGGPEALNGMEALVHTMHDNDRVTVFLSLVERAESVLKLSLKIGALEGADLR